MQHRVKRRVVLALTEEHWAALQAEAEEQLRTLDDEVSFNISLWAKQRIQQERTAIETAERSRAAAEVARQVAEAARQSAEKPVEKPPADFVPLGEALEDPISWSELHALTKAGHVVPNQNEGGFSGVHRNGRRWRAIATVERDGHKEKVTVGTFDSPEEAAVARGRFLLAERQREEDEQLQKEVECRTILRPVLLQHPAYEQWIWAGMKVGGLKTPCPFELGVRYTVDAKTLQVTRDADGVVIVPAQPSRTGAS